ncbi:MAG: hypothetical protein IJ348_03090 [Alistipes sp.]|nr:hypothetical protein [Alistipes sp.]
MRVLRYILCLVVLLALGSCERDYDNQELMSQVRFVLELPDSDGDGVADTCESAISMESSYISEYNTRENYIFGVFRNNTSSVRLRKGIYTLMLDATIYFEDGTIKAARNTEYAQPNTALKILNDKEEVRLKMTYLY